MERHPRQDSHLQPSRSKRGALVIELRGYRKIGQRRACSPDPAMGPLGFRDRSGALVRFTVHGKLAPSVGLAPTPFRLTGGRAPLTPRRILWRNAAGAGIAPTCPRLQRGAHLSKPSSGKNWARRESHPVRGGKSSVLISLQLRTRKKRAAPGTCTPLVGLRNRSLAP